jgi:hypothetical protein
MYSLEEYIKQNAGRLSWITNAEKQIIPVAGLDRAASLLQSYSGNIYPIILVEDATGGNINYEAEFLNVSIHNFWIMNKPEHPDLANERNQIMNDCYDKCLDIIKILIEDDNSGDSAHGWNNKKTRWERRRTSYMPMSNIGLCYGWLFMLTFSTDMKFQL